MKVNRPYVNELIKHVSTWFIVPSPSNVCKIVLRQKFALFCWSPCKTLLCTILIVWVFSLPLICTFSNQALVGKTNADPKLNHQQVIIW